MLPSGDLPVRVQPLLFRAAEDPHVVLVVILQARSLDGAAEMVFHFAAPKPVRRGLDFAFAGRDLFAQTFFRRFALLLQLLLHGSELGFVVFFPFFQGPDHDDHQDEGQHAANGQKHAGPHDAPNAYVAFLMAFLDVPPPD